MSFPDGLPYNLRTKKIGTAKMSALYTLATIKQDPSISEESLLVNLTTTQVETLFGELEYIEVRLQVLGVVGAKSTRC